MAATARVEGARELRASLQRAGADLVDMKDANAAVAAYVAAGSRSAAPVVTGRLRATVRGSRATSAAVVTAGGPGVPYAGPIHWGWPARNIAAHPFMADTAAQAQPTWTDMYRSAVRRVVARIRGK